MSGLLYGARSARGIGVALACCWAGLAVCGGERLTYADLVGRMTDLAGLAVLPPPGESGGLASSRDRRSRYDPTNGVYVAWDANGDGSGAVSKDKVSGTLVMAELEGPGCIWRVWSATAGEGHVKIYLDGAETPAVDLPFQDYFTGKTAPFAYPGLSYDLRGDGCAGLNLYVPIPYRTSCRIVAEKGWGSYYQFSHTSFPKGTEVPTFSTALAAENAAALGAADAFFRGRLGEDPAGARKGAGTVRLEAELPPGGSKALRLDGARAVTALRLARPAASGAEEDEARMVRLTSLRITFDDAAEPQVVCPLGDFFGTAPGWNPYRTLATGMTTNAAYAYWYMPFAKNAQIELVNDGAEAARFTLDVTHAPLGRPFEGLGYFHCKWHRNTFAVPQDRMPDWSVLRTEGRGRFLGFMLHVWCPLGGWWGEGDEKFFVDGEKMPSIFGTGSEDYFGYAWCHPGLFQRPFHAQTKTENNSGHQSVLRWQVAENVPFQTAFDGYIEHYHGNPTEYAATVCWYLAPGGKDPYGLAFAGERYGYCVPLPRYGGGFRILGTPPGETWTQQMGHFGEGKWERNDQLLWMADRTGGRLDVELNVPKKGTYAVFGHLTKAAEYAIVQFYINDEKAGEPVDLYNGPVIPVTVPLGTHALKAGAATLTAEVIGINEKAYKKYMVGIDWIELVRQDEQPERK